MSMLKVSDLRAGYGRLGVLKNLSFEVPDGMVVALLGGNGAGKTTTMKAIMGLIRTESGSIEFNGERIDHAPPHQVFARGLSLVPQGRELFSEMTVAENLELGALQRGRGRYEDHLASVLELLPELQEQLRKRAGTLSGGQQQMLATARALMSNPQLLLMDEPTMGLAPLVVTNLRHIIERLKYQGKTILLVEQNIRLALRLANYVYVIRSGTVVAHGEPESFKDDSAMFLSYIG